MKEKPEQKREFPIPEDPEGLSRPEVPFQYSLKKYISHHFHLKDVFTPPESSPEHHPSRKPVSRLMKNMLVLLKLSPWLTAVGFIVSFFIDFGPDAVLPVFGYPLPLESLLRIISVSGLIGFFTNWLAIKMLFKPVERRPVWGQGLIPAQRDIIIAQLAAGIHRNILSEELIAKRIESSGVIGRLNKLVVKGVANMLHDEDFRKEVKGFVYWHLKDYLEKEKVQGFISQKIDEKLEQKLKKGFKSFLFKTYRRMNPKDYQMVLQGLIMNIPASSIEAIEELERHTPDLSAYLEEKSEDTEAFFTQLVLDVLERIDIYELLRKQMEHFDEAKLERMIWSSTSDQLQYIQYLGTVLGMLGGLLIWQPVPVIITYAGLFGCLYITDQVLYRLKQKKV